MNVINSWFEKLQTLPLGEHLVAIAGSGMRILVALAIVALCVIARGWLNLLFFADAEEKQRLHEGNSAFVINQLFVVAAFVFSLGAALTSTANVPAFLDKVIVALTVQVIAMISLRVTFRKVHHRMLHGDIWSGVRLGVITMLIGILTAFEMMR